jgi:hypothetical protein
VARVSKIHPATVRQLLAQATGSVVKEEQPCQIMLIDLCLIILKVTIYH